MSFGILSILNRISLQIVRGTLEEVEVEVEEAVVVAGVSIREEWRGFQ